MSPNAIKSLQRSLIPLLTYTIICFQPGAWRLAPSAHVRAGATDATFKCAGICNFYEASRRPAHNGNVVHSTCTRHLWNAVSSGSDTHGYHEESDATHDHCVRQELHQRDMTEETLDAVRESNDFMVLND